LAILVYDTTFVVKLQQDSCFLPLLQKPLFVEFLQASAHTYLLDTTAPFLSLASFLSLPYVIKSVETIGAINIGAIVVYCSRP
jgi:hypothetical protein